MLVDGWPSQFTRSLEIEPAYKIAVYSRQTRCLCVQ
jgi:hypothetical protein